MFTFISTTNEQGKGGLLGRDFKKSLLHRDTFREKGGFRPRLTLIPPTMNLGIHEAQRAGYSLAQAAGLGTDVMEGQAACRAALHVQLLVH